MHPLVELYDEQSRGCPTQAPVESQVPPTRQVPVLPLVQLVPTGFGSVHVCVVSLQVRQLPAEVQSMGVPRQFPLKSHWSPVVQNIPSLQVVP